MLSLKNKIDKNLPIEKIFEYKNFEIETSSFPSVYLSFAWIHPSSYKIYQFSHQNSSRTHATIYFSIFIFNFYFLRTNI